MALTRKQFRDAISYLTENAALSGTGTLWLDADKQRVLDEGNANADITPSQSILEQALIDSLSEQASKQQLDDARKVNRGNILERVRTELEQESPDWATLYTDARNFVLSNARLTQAMLNRVALHEAAYGISIDSTTQAGKARYLDIALTLIPLYM
jgi:hypothetical protein